MATVQPPATAPDTPPDHKTGLRALLSPGPLAILACLLALAFVLGVARPERTAQDQLVGIILLVLIFAIAMWRDISMGVVAMPVAFLMGTFYFGMKGPDIAKGFPGALVTTLIGVTYLFGVARSNGTIANIVRVLVNLVRGKVFWIPWVFFFLGAALSASGALSLAVYAILIPLGMQFCKSNKISPLVMGLSILNGTNAGGFSPIAIYYVIVSGAFKKAGIIVEPLPVFFWTFVVNLLLNVVAYLLFAGKLGEKLGIVPTKVTATEGQGEGTIDGRAVGGRWTPIQQLTLVLFLAMIVFAVVMQLDVGYMAFVVAAILGLLDPDSAKKGTKEIGWGVVLLVAGIVTFTGVLETKGVITSLSNSVAHFGTPLIAALLMLLVAAIVSAFASTNAMFILLAPLSAPLLTQGGIGVLGFTIALCLSASVVDSSPFSNAGALMLANTDDYLYDKTMKWCMVWAFGMIPVAPLLTWLAFVVL